LGSGAAAGAASLSIAVFAGSASSLAFEASSSVAGAVSLAPSSLIVNLIICFNESTSMIK
jgi:hypothetical protein